MGCPPEGFSLGGAVAVEALAFALIVTSLVALALRGIDPSLVEAARVAAHGSGKGARHMPEHLAREELLGQRGAAHHRKGTMPAGTPGYG